MGRRRGGVMSDALKWEIAKELGVDHIVKEADWGEVPARQCGNLVRVAIEMAERNLSQAYLAQTPLK